MSVAIGAGAIAATGSTFVQSVAAASSIDVDPTWHDGAAFNPTESGLGEVSDIVVDGSGATYLLGRVDPRFPVSGAIAKLDPAGHADTAFGLRSFTYDGLRMDEFGAGLLQPDGHLIASGPRGDRWIVLRADVSTSFEFLVSDVADLSASLGRALDPNFPVTMAVRADGSLVLGGIVYDESFHTHVAVVRLHADLTLDESFGTGGYLIDPFAPVEQFYGGTAVVNFDSSGRILVSVPRFIQGPILFRLTTIGTLDSTFASAGVLDEHLPGPVYGCTTAFTVDAHDRIVTVCPHERIPGNAGVSRYLPDGTLDTTFGDRGTAHVTPSAGSTWSDPTVVRAQGDSIVVGGRTRDSSTVGGPTDYAVWRFTAEGRLDRSFGGSGGVIRDHGGASGWVRSAVVTADEHVTVLTTADLDVSGKPPQQSVFRVGADTVTPQPMTLLGAPTRVLDTRTGLPAGAAKVLAGGVLALPLAGSHGIKSDAAAVILNVTVTEPEAAGYLTVYPCGQPPPVASNINYATGQTIANLVISRLGTNGAICLFSSQTTHVVADVTAGESSAADVHPLPAPLRLIDTRSALGWSLPIKIGSTLPAGNAPVIGLNEIPSSTWVKEVLLNVTVTQPDHPGYLTVYQCSTSAPLASNLNFTAGQTISNFVAVRISQASEISAGICFHSSTTTHLVVDLEATIDVGAADLALPQPTRVLDTRSGIGAPVAKILAGVPLELQIRPPTVGNDATAVGINVTATEPDAAGYLTVYPCGQAPPVASNLNFAVGDTVPNYVIARLGEGGKICIVSNVSTHVVVDLTEFFTP